MRGLCLLSFLVASATPQLVLAQDSVALTAEELASFQSQIEPCWRVVDSAHLVSVRIRLTPDGFLAEAPVILEPATWQSDEAMIASVDATVEALERCQTETHQSDEARNGYDLPREKYESWQTMQLVFDPTAVTTPPPSSTLGALQ